MAAIGRGPSNYEVVREHLHINLTSLCEVAPAGQPPGRRRHKPIVLLLGGDGQRPTGGGRLSTGGGQSTPRVTQPIPAARLQRDGIEYLDPVFNQKLDSRPVPGGLG